MNSDCVALPRHLKLCIWMICDLLQKPLDPLEIFFSALLMVRRILKLSNPVNNIGATEVITFDVRLSGTAQSRNCYTLRSRKELSEKDRAKFRRFSTGSLGEAWFNKWMHNV